VCCNAGELTGSSMKRNAYARDEKHTLSDFIGRRITRRLRPWAI
jgi:hypothetical protein